MWLLKLQLRGPYLHIGADEADHRTTNTGIYQKLNPLPFVFFHLPNLLRRCSNAILQVNQGDSFQVRERQRSLPPTLIVCWIVIQMFPSPCG
jgi:hypothetical protein